MQQQPPQLTSYDVWLSRLSQLAQVAGVCLALFGLYYTVIPLYQKAAVDEQLARKEIELKLVEQDLLKSRQAVYEIERERTTFRLLFNASNKCSGIAEAISQIPDDDLEKSQARALSLPGDIPSCLEQAVEDFIAEGSLNADDSKFLKNRAFEIGEKLMRDRAVVIEKIAKLPYEAQRDRSLLDPPGKHVAEYDAKVDEWNGKLPIYLQKDYSHQRLRQQIGWTQRNLAQRFRMDALNHIRQELIPSEWKGAAKRNDEKNSESHKKKRGQE